VARRATVIKQARAAERPSLVLDAGDALLFDADPARSSRGATSVEALNRLGYDAVALGGYDLSRLTIEELRTRISEAAFPFLSCNAFVADTEQLVGQPYVVIDVNGASVGILGLSDPPEAGQTEVSVTDPLDAARAYVPEVARETDIMILLSHVGVETDQEIARAVGGIDVIVSGKDYAPPEPLIVAPHGTLIVQASRAVPGIAGTHIGWAELGFDRMGNLARHSWHAVELNVEYNDDPAMAAWLRELYATE